MRLLDTLNQISDRVINSNFAFIKSWADSFVSEVTAADTALQSDIDTIEGDLTTALGDIEDIQEVLSPKCKFTAEGGLAIYVTNGSGGTLYKGELVSASTTNDNQIVKQANEFDTIGVVYDATIGTGADGWIVIAGVAEVMLEDTQAATRGYVIIAAPTDGRAKCIAVPSSNPVVAEHFKEIGHCIESANAGTSVLFNAVLHFN